MPSHRKERLPRHRARRQADNPAGRADLHAAVAPEQPPHPDAQTEPLVRPSFAAQSPERDGIGGFAFSAGLHEASAVGGDDTRPERGRQNRPAVLGGAARGMLVSPWFAAGAGLVIASALWLHAPHALLTFPATAPCTVDDCTSPPAHGSGSLATNTGSPIEQGQPSASEPVKQSGTPHHAAAPLPILLFDVLSRSNDKFTAVITIVGNKPLGSWRLGFSIPGAIIVEISGIAWDPSGPSGGTAESSPDDGPTQNGNPSLATFLLVATGSPNTPVDCVYNGTSCSFG